jgi:hypothetical protein
MMAAHTVIWLLVGLVVIATLCFFSGYLIGRADERAAQPNGADHG